MKLTPASDTEGITGFGRICRMNDGQKIKPLALEVHMEIITLDGCDIVNWCKADLF